LGSSAGAEASKDRKDCRVSVNGNNIKITVVNYYYWP